ncbi:tyrosine-protein phosphatase Lar-like isoform X2 [Tachypleus tridentatus]|uniref:tyrosine-protein phosphatase Lar-like isoform X2 n=1 Tax=Tachypleus tridentatus TaxID=6853 RepID=UPI003FD023D7
MFSSIGAFTFLLLVIHSTSRSTTSTDEPPRIVTAPRNQTVISGGVASFVCTALGNPNPIIEWRKGNRRLTVPHYTIQEIPNGSVLRIEPEHLKRDKSVYKCLAENGVGEPAYAAVELRVLPEDHIPLGFPQFTVHPRMKAVEKGRTVLLNCQAEGNPTPTITWLKNMIPLNLDDPRLSIIQGTYLQITQAKKEDEGTYECLAENSIGSSFSEQALLFVRVRLVPPRFSTLPEPIYKVMPGSNLNLTCVAEGSPVPYVKWRNGSFDLTPEHSIPVGKNVLQLENIQESTNYTCVAASKLGNIESVTTILVQEFVGVPKNVQTCSLGSSTVVIQWDSPEEHNGQVTGYKVYFTTRPKLPTTDWNTQNIDNGTLAIISDVTPETIYTIRIQALTGTGSGPLSDPVQVETQEGVPSQPLNLLVKFTSSTTVELEWSHPEHSSENVIGYELYWNDTFTKKQYHRSIPPITSYIMSNLYPDILYHIWLAARSKHGEGAPTQPVTVKTDQYLPDEPMNVKVEPISSTSLQVQWKRPANKDKNGLIRGYQIHIQERDENNGSVGAAIRFDVTNEVEEAYNVTGLRPDTTYTVQVATVTWKGDGIHSHPRTSKTKRGEPPRIVTAPRNQTVISGGVASFVCTALGNPKPIIEWRKGNRRLTVPHYTIQEIPDGSVLRIEPEHLKRDKSVYKCLAENGVGEPAYAAVELRVLPKDHIPLGFPLFTVHPRMKAVEKGRTVLLNCQAEGNPTPTITWLKNMIPLNLDDPRLSIIQGTYLQITQAKKEDDGTYECLAENSIGSSFSEQALLYVRVRLVPPRFSTLPEPIYKVVPGLNLNLTCVAEGSPVPYVKWRNGSFDLTPEHSIPVGKNVLQLENIQESTNYTCVAASKLGNIESVTTILVQEFVGVPRNVQTCSLSSSTVVIHWDPPEERNGQVTGYKVYFTTRPKLPTTDWNTQNVDNSTLAIINDVTPQTIYTIRIQALTGTGSGPLSDLVQVETQQGVPSQPLNLLVKFTSSTTVELEWSHPEHSSENVIGYELYWNDTFTKKQYHRSIPPITSYIMSNLYPDILYHIWLAARSKHGEGAPTQPVTVKTDQYLPDEPMNVKVEPISSTSLQVQWKRPANKDKNGLIRGYQIHIQEKDENNGSVGAAIRFAVTNEVEEAYNVTGLRPDTTYTVQVATVTWKGDGIHSHPRTSKTKRGGEIVDM